jgi:Subtilase family
MKNNFPHIQLKLVQEGTSVPNRGGANKNQRTENNINNRQGHGRKLKTSIESLIFDWENQLKQREEENLPKLPNAIPIILQIDPQIFDPDALKSFDIEIIAELEEGYIIGSAVDVTKLQQKIAQFLKAAIEQKSSRSWVIQESEQTSDYVENGGHGTRVAGAVLYPRNIPDSGTEKAICWLQNARILNADNNLDERIFMPNLLKEIVDFYYNKTGTKIFNHSINDSLPYRTQYMSDWAATIDNLTWENDIIFIVSAGNLKPYQKIGLTRLSIIDHLQANRNYPDYLLEKSCRIANPAQSFQCLTVGSIAFNDYHKPPLSSLAKKDYPSSFSCTGLGIWDTIKPEVVEYGGDLVIDENNPPSITYPPAVCTELVRSTLNGGPLVDSDNIGTSFAAPKVTHILARLMANLPDQSCLLYRALIVQSARWPQWTNEDNINKLDILRLIGYGIPDSDRALGNSPHRITLITQKDCFIKAKQVHIYQVKLPDYLISQGEDFEILLEVTLSYKAQPRRTRRNRRKYLSTWLDWDCSKKGESPDFFLSRMVKEIDNPESTSTEEKGFKWTLGKQSNWGIIKGISRSSGTIQKDWAIVKSYDLTEAFCIAVIGHQGWNNDPDVQVPYSLVISIEAIQINIPIYASIAQVQLETLVETEIRQQSIINNQLSTIKL